MAQIYSRFQIENSHFFSQLIVDTVLTRIFKALNRTVVIVHRKCTRLLTARGRPQPALEQPEAPGDDPLSVLEADERQASLREALAELPDHERAAAQLHYLEDLPHQQVAHRLGLTTAAVRKRMQRARQHLRERMSAMSPDLFDDERPSQNPRFSQELLHMLEASEPRQAFEARTEEDGQALAPDVARVEEHRRRLAGLGDADLRARSGELKAEVRARRTAPELDRLLPEAYALAIESFQRTQTAAAAWDEGQILEAALMHHGRAVAVAD